MHAIGCQWLLLLLILLDAIGWLLLLLLLLWFGAVRLLHILPRGDVQCPPRGIDNAPWPIHNLC